MSEILIPPADGKCLFWCCGNDATNLYRFCIKHLRHMERAGGLLKASQLRKVCVECNAQTRNTRKGKCARCYYIDYYKNPENLAKKRELGREYQRARKVRDRMAA